MAATGTALGCGDQGNVHGIRHEICVEQETFLLALELK